MGIEHRLEPSAARPRRGRAGVLVAGIACLALLVATPAFAAEEESSGWEAANRAGRTAFDAVILRPLQLAQVVISAAVFVPSYPVAWLFGGEDDVLDLCITEPVARFMRPLGEL